jgi:hypothetical protein
MESYVFKTNKLCMFIGCTEEEYGQSYGTIIKVDDGGEMLYKIIEKNRIIIFFMKEDETMSYQERSQSKTQLVNEVVEGKMLMVEF